MNAKKIKLSFFILVSLFTLIISKAFYIQILNKDKLIKYSNSQFLRKTTIHPKRGIIYDRNLNPLAINIDTYNLFFIPKKEKNLKIKLLKLDKILNTKDANENYRKIKKEKVYMVVP